MHGDISRVNPKQIFVSSVKDKILGAMVGNIWCIKIRSKKNECFFYDF